MTKAKTTDETKNEEVIDETVEKADVENFNAQYDKPLYTGDFGGHVLHDSGE